MPAATDKVYQLKISLRDIRPPIWRRVQVPADITLGKLHDIIQAAMGWEDCHMHAFTVNGVAYGQPDPELEMESEDQITLRKAAPKEKSHFRYEYDFGDGWDHEILVEKILPVAPGVAYPVCITGKRACPPEDSGGVWGYANLVQMLADPESEGYEDALEWFGNEFDPTAFDLKEANWRLARLR